MGAAVTQHSTTDLLVLHAVRLRGLSTAAEAAARYGLNSMRAEELLLDHQAYGWVSWSEFASMGGWSLTERGRTENERELRLELDSILGARATVTAVHDDFVPLNVRLQQASTDWQVRPRPGQPLAMNEHRDADWDGRIITEFGRLSVALAPLVSRLGSVLARFRGYDDRFGMALRRAVAGDGSALTGVDHDSCHAVWFELHEDLLATLGLSRTS